MRCSVYDEVDLWNLKVVEMRLRDSELCRKGSRGTAQHVPKTRTAERWPWAAASADVNCASWSVKAAEQKSVAQSCSATVPGRVSCGSSCVAASFPWLATSLAHFFVGSGWVVLHCCFEVVPVRSRTR